MRTRVIRSLSDVPAADWNGLAPTGAPFLRHEFLFALEASGVACAQTGWHPCHVLCESDDGTLLGAMPLYQKTHPYGEFVFDFAWANAYQRAGLAYYPKLVCAVPFTPVSGPRLLLRKDASAVVPDLLLEAALAFAGSSHASSLHILFPDAASRTQLRNHGLLMRKDCQFHWHNRNYRNFDDFLATFTAVKRKKVRRERRRVREAGIVFRTLTGHDLTPGHWDSIMPLYAGTFLRRGREPYLNRDFFVRVSAALPDNVVVFAGYRGTELTGVAICFRNENRLYGRYWGAREFVDSLHFETCYYQGIDYCIREGLEEFEPGTQGEHKIARGFVPTETWSAHWLSHPQFSAAVDEYIGEERRYVEHYMHALDAHVPYKKSLSGD